MPKYNIDITLEIDDFDAEDESDASRMISDYIDKLAKIAGPLNWGSVKWSALALSNLHETESN